MFKDKKILNWLAGIVGVILLGAIGSGVWQMIGQPLVDFIMDAIINTINLFFTSYKDSIYAQASVGFHEQSANYIFMLVIFLGTALPLINIVKRKANSSERSNSQKHMVRSVILVVNLSILMSLSIYMATQLSYINRIILYVNVSLDRLSPYESQEKIIELRAEFREVSSANDYYVLYNEIEALINKNGLKSKSTPPL